MGTIPFIFHVVGTRPAIAAAAGHILPLDLSYLLTKSGEVLRELDHQNDEGPPEEHAGRPEQ